MHRPGVALEGEGDRGDEQHRIVDLLRPQTETERRVVARIAKWRDQDVRVLVDMVNTDLLGDEDGDTDDDLLREVED